MKEKRISVLISDELRQKKANLGVNWRYTIEKGLDFISKANSISNTFEENEKNKEKLIKMSKLVQDLVEKRNEYERKYGVI